jgi:glycerol uptake facilitator-like aquaporin
MDVAHFSAAHFNPSVTLGVLAARRTTILRALSYISEFSAPMPFRSRVRRVPSLTDGICLCTVAQFVGALIGAAIARSFRWGIDTHIHKLFT